jgi:hypothetical protein
MLHHVALARTDVSEERIASINRVTIKGHIVFLRSVLLLIVAANVPSSPILVTLMMKATLSSETSVLTRAIRRHIPEKGVLQEEFCLCLCVCEYIENWQLEAEGRRPPEAARNVERSRRGTRPLWRNSVMPHNESDQTVR